MKTKAEHIRQVQALLDKAEPDLAKGFIEAMQRLRDDLTLKQIAELVQAGNIQGALTLLGPVQVGAALGGMLNATLATYYAAGDMASRESPVSVWFNHANPTAAANWSRYQQQRVQQITEEVAQTINQVMRRSLSQGIGPMDTARQIKDTLGLTASQEQAVFNYRTALQNRLSNALDRKLRDRRFDATVRRAIENDKGLNADQIDKMVTRYRERMVQARAQTIARTESTRAVNAGQQAYIETAVQDKVADMSQVRRFWVPTRDERTRDAHRMIPTMNPDGVGLNEPFRSPDGPIMYPGDPSASAGNTINCRCALFTRILPKKE